METLSDFDFSDLNELDSKSYLATRAHLLRELDSQDRHLRSGHEHDTRLLPQDGSTESETLEQRFKLYEPPDLSMEALRTNKIMHTAVKSTKEISQAL